MGYNGSIIVLVFSTSIFITWGTTVLIFMTWGTTVLIFMTWGTTVLSLYLYFPHQSLWHGYNGSIIVLVFSTSIFMTQGTMVLSLYLYFPHQSLWQGVQQFYHCTCIFHINLYDMGYNGSNIYDMMYNGSIIVLVFSTSIFMTWSTTVLSLYLYFPHQSLWHGVQRFYHCTCIFKTTWQFNSLQVFQKIHLAINGGEIHRDI
jgi:hypothetical protein